MTSSRQPTLRYPRRTVLRWVMRQLARLLLRLLTKQTLNGLANIPSDGPVILAGNHVGVLEAVLMIAHSQRQVEILGNGDIPFDRGYGWLVNLYGFIPVNRGNLDRSAIQASLDVLRQGGVLGIFPEGGIWDPAHMEAQLGVALLSQRSGAPVVPIGFGGMQNALVRALRFKHPYLSMRVGQPLLPPEAPTDQKEALREQANRTLAAITALIPPEELANRPSSEAFALSLSRQESEGNWFPVNLEGAESVARTLLNDVILDVFQRNLGLPVNALLTPSPTISMAEFHTAIGAILVYLETNPGFLRYRLGVENGLLAEAGLRQLASLTEPGQTSALRLILSRTREYPQKTPETIQREMLLQP